MGGPRVVVFDLGGVLIDWNPRHLYRKIFPDEAAMEVFLTDICNGAWNIEQDRGRPFAEAVALLQARHPEQADHIAAYRARWPEMLGSAIEGSVAILERLHAAGVPLYALTNWSAETFDHARARYGFLGLFRDILVSGVERLVKPDPAIYRLLAQRGGFAPGEAVFIDDSPANVEGARAVGMTALHFTTPAALARDLRALGIDPG